MSNLSKIKCKCPHCKKNFELKDAITENLINDIENDIRVDIKKMVEIDKLQEVSNVKSHYKEFYKDKYANDLSKEINKLSKNTEKNKEENRTLVIENRNLQEEIKSLKTKNDRNVKAQINEAVLTERAKNNDERYKDKLYFRKEKENLMEIIHSLQNSVNLSSNQIKGDVGEIIIKDNLKKEFSQFEIQPIKKGENGGDCILHYRRGTFHYMIKYESKRVKKYNPIWEKKLLSDMKDKNIMYGLIVTEVMPKNKNAPFMVNGNIWVCKFNDFLHITSIIIELFNQIYKRDQVNSTDKSEAKNILNFLTSPAFAHSINSLVNTYYENQAEIDFRERTFRKDIEKSRTINSNLFKSIIDMYSGLEAVSKNMPKIKGIENTQFPDLKLIN